MGKIKNLKCMERIWKIAMRFSVAERTIGAACGTNRAGVKPRHGPS